MEPNFTEPGHYPFISHAMVDGERGARGTFVVTRQVKEDRLSEQEASAAIAAFLRWEISGGVWRVLEPRTSYVSVALLRCDGGEEVDRIGSADPRWLAYLAEKDSSEDSEDLGHQSGPLD